MISRWFCAAAILVTIALGEADARGRFDGRTFFFANRTLSTIQCAMYINDVREPYLYVFEPNDELWTNLAPEQTLTLSCPSVTGRGRIGNLLPMRRYLFLRTGDHIALYEVALRAERAN